MHSCQINSGKTVAKLNFVAAELAAQNFRLQIENTIVENVEKSSAESVHLIKQ